MNDRSRQAIAKFVGIILFFVFMLLSSLISQRDLEYVLDLDFRTAGFLEWRKFFLTLDPSVLSYPQPHPYLDGQLIVAGAVAALLQVTTEIFPSTLTIFPKDESYSLGAVIVVSILSYAGACTIFYAAMVRATRSIAWSALLATALFLSPQMLAIGLVRIDHLITFPLAAVFYCSVVLAIREEGYRHAIVLGSALGFLATLKLNGPIFVLLPVCAVIARLSYNRTELIRLLGFSSLSLGVFLVAYAIFMARYLYFYTLEQLLNLYPAAGARVTAWSSIIPWDWSTYYNVQLLKGHGWEFIVLYLLSAAVLLWAVVVRGNRLALFLLLALFSLSAYSSFTMKYDRGGYHLLPLFFAVIGVAWIEVRRAPWPQLDQSCCCGCNTAGHGIERDAVLGTLPRARRCGGSDVDRS